MSMTLLDAIDSPLALSGYSLLIMVIADFKTAKRIAAAPHGSLHRLSSLAATFVGLIVVLDALLHAYAKQNGGTFPYFLLMMPLFLKIIALTNTLSENPSHRPDSKVKAHPTLPPATN